MERILIGDSPIVIGRGLALSDLVAPRPERAVAAVVTQPGAKHVAEAVTAELKRGGLECHLMVLPDTSKDLPTVERVYEWLRQLRITRHDLVVAVGGGAVTDLAGFVASTYLRGVDVIYVPATLLAAVDAAIGGKTAVDFGAKNLIGTFRLPTLVAIDLDTIDAVPAALATDGLAEVAKTALIADESLVEALESHGPGLDVQTMVSRCVAAKSAIVIADFQEKGGRAVLNYGHTIGHAVETATGIAHGKAVSVGMEAAAAASAALSGFQDRQRQTDLLAGLGLPVSAPFDTREVLRLIDLDKKRTTAGTTMVLLSSIANPQIVAVDDATVSAALDAVTEMK